MHKVTVYSNCEHSKEYEFETLEEAYEFAEKMKNQQYRVVINYNTTKYIVTWRSKSAPVRKTASFDDDEIAESFYREKQAEGKSPALYVTELVESTRHLK